MNKLKIAFLLISIGLSTKGFSQLSNFDLTKYKLPDLERRSLETNFNISGYNNYDKFPSQEITGYEENRTNQYDGDIYLNYSYYLNNAQFQRESNFGFNFSSDFYNRSLDNELENKSSNFSPLFFFHRVDRRYVNEKLFFETDLVLTYQYANNKRFSKSTWDDSERKDNLQTHSALALIPFKIGIGRIEPVQDARQAVYLFDELLKIERLSSGKSDEEIIELAKLISQLKNKRIFDSRLRRMAEIEKVDSFLISNNYISEPDAKYFTTLNDFWAYGNRPMRNSGTRFSGALLPGYYRFDFNNTGDGIFFNADNYNLSALLIDGGVELKHEKPINLSWQNSIDINCYAGTIEGKLNDKTNLNEIKIRIPTIQLGYYQTIGFFPNTRTGLSFRYSVQYVQLFDKTDLQNEILGAEGKGAKVATDLSINYYISPKFRLNAASTFYYIWQDSKDEVIINFDNVAESNYLLSHFTSNTIWPNNYYNIKKIANSFTISLIYTLF